MLEWGNGHCIYWINVTWTEMFCFIDQGKVIGYILNSLSVIDFKIPGHCPKWQNWQECLKCWNLKIAPSASIFVLLDFRWGTDREQLKKRSGWPLGLTLPSREAVREMWNFFDKLQYLGLFCRFIQEKNGSTFSQIEAVRLGGGWPPLPPKW